MYKVFTGEVLGDRLQRRRDRLSRKRRTREERIQMMERTGEVRRRWAVEELQLARKERVERLHIISYAADLERGDDSLLKSSCVLRGNLF